MRWFAILVLTVVLAVAPAMPVAAVGPGLTVSSPTDGATIQGTSFTVTFQVSDFTIVPSTVPLAEAGKRPEVNRSGEGHLHLTLDLQPLVVWYTNAPYTFNNVPPGQHQLIVELANNDHALLSPQVMKTVRFTTVTAAMMPQTGKNAAGLGQTGWLLVIAGATLLLTGGIIRRRRRARN